MNYKEFLNLFGGAIFVFIIRVIGACAVFLTQIFLARWIGAAEVGVYVYAFSLFNLLAIIAGMGLYPSALRHIGKGLALNQHDVVVGFAQRGRELTFLAGNIVAFIGLLVVHYTNGIVAPNYVVPLTFAMAGIPLMCLINWQSTIAQCMNWFSAAFVPTNVTRPVLLILAIAAAHHIGYNYRLNASSVLLMHLGIMLFVWMTSALYLKLRLKRRFKGVEPRYQTKLWVSTGLPLLLIILFTNFFLDINIVIVGFSLDAEQLGIFNASFRVAVLIAFGIQSVDAILMPKFTQYHAAEEHDKLQRIVALTTQLKFWASLCGLAIFAVFGREVLAFFGDEFVQGYNALIILSVSQVVRAAVGPLSQMLSVTGHHSYCLVVAVVSILLMLGLNYWLIGTYGVIGAAIVVVAVISFEALLLTIACKKYLRLNASIFAIFSLKKIFH